MNKNQTNTAKAAAGIATLAAAAATAFYFGFSGKAKQHRQKAKSWANKAKKEVVKDIKKLEVVTKPAYEALVGEVLRKYEGYKDAAPEELTALGKELKGYWKQISSQIKTDGKKPAAKSVKAKSIKTKKATAKA